MTANKIDLATCDNEPIHLIGAVQPHGALIALDADSLIISYASQNTFDFVGFTPEDMLGKPLSFLVGAQNAAQLPEQPEETVSPELLNPWFVEFAGREGQTIKAECLHHRSKGHVILEFLPTKPAPAAVWEDELLRRSIISELIKPEALGELAEASARLIRDVTGFDRVMIYKFAEDKHGEVIAESTNRPDSFVGLHYPASDIPEPARRHFALNVMRSIPDIKGIGVPIVGLSGEVADAASETPLDLTFSKLRAVAPVHLEYLGNMGVGASMSISLITSNKLWGLVACHHYSPRLVSSSRMRFAELLGVTTSALLQSIENSNQLRKGIAAEKTSFLIEKQVRAGVPLRSLIEEQAEKMMELSKAQGLYLALGGERVQIGLADGGPVDYTALRKLSDDGVATSDCLSKVLDMNETQKATIAGAALLSLSDDGKDFLVFLRSNYHQIISWAGKPEKIEKLDENGVRRLSPRGSFALWQEEREDKSKPYDDVDRDALRILRRALFALNSVERERLALEAQRSAEAEELRLRNAFLDAARASSLGELASAIAHELNQPLSAISNYVSACQQEFKNAGVAIPEQAKLLIDDALAETARAGELIRRVRDFISRGDLNADYIDLNATIKQSIGLALVSRDLPDLRVEYRLDPDLPPIFADPVQIGQVILNLALNSITAMKETTQKILTLDVKLVDEHVQVSVSDTGVGIPLDAQKYVFEPFHASTTKGMGIGLSLCRSIVEAHSGRIWTEPSELGATLVFQLPLRGELDD